MNTKTNSKSITAPFAGVVPRTTQIIMKTALNRIVDKIMNLRDLANDEEFIDELENALIHLEAASDRLLAIEEEDEEA